MIENVYLTKYSNSLHFEFMSELHELLLKLGVEEDKLNVLVLSEKFKTTLVTESLSMKKLQGSLITQQLKVTDATRIRLFNALSLGLQSNLLHYNEQKRTSAERINIFLSQHKKLAKQNLNSKSGIIQTITDELSTRLLNDATAIGIQHWVAPLKKANDEFKQLMNNRTDDKLENTAPSMKIARKDTDEAYKELITRINALALVNGGPLFISFVATHNARIAYYKTTLAQSGTRTKNDGEENIK